MARVLPATNFFEPCLYSYSSIHALALAFAHSPSHQVFYMQNGYFGNDHEGLGIHRSPSPDGFLLHTNSDSGDEDDLGVENLRVPKLRSRPPIDFTGRHSTVNHRPSLMSGSTLLHSVSNPSMFLRKSSRVALDSPSRLSSEDIISLTESELYLNPRYRKLRQDFDHVSTVLATYVERDLAESRANPLVPDIRQGA